MPRTSSTKLTKAGENVSLSDKNARQIYIHLGKKIWKARKSKGMTQEELATHLNLNRVSISMLEAGKQGASIVMLLIIAKVLKVPVVELLPEKYRAELCGPVEPMKVSISGSEGAIDLTIKDPSGKVTVIPIPPNRSIENPTSGS